MLNEGCEVFPSYPGEGACWAAPCFTSIQVPVAVCSTSQSFHTPDGNRQTPPSASATMHST